MISRIALLLLVTELLMNSCHPASPGTEISSNWKAIAVEEEIMTFELDVPVGETDHVIRRFAQFAEDHSFEIVVRRSPQSVDLGAVSGIVSIEMRRGTERFYATNGLSRDIFSVTIASRLRGAEGRTRIRELASIVSGYLQLGE